MKTTWSLDELYTSFDSEAFQNDLIAAKNEIERIRQWASENLRDHTGETEKIAEYINMVIGFEKYYNMSRYSSLMISVETENKQAVKYMDILQEMYTELSDPSVLFEKFVTDCADLDAVIASSDILKEHTFYLQRIKENGKYCLSEKEELIIAKMENTGSSAWSKMKEQLASTLLIDINVDGEDKKLPLSVVRNMAEHDDTSVRKAAYEAELQGYAQVERAVAAALNGIKGEVLTISKLRGYESPLDMTVKNSRMNMNILNAMLSAIQDYLPAFEKYFRKKAELLGHKDGLPFYELFAPAGSVNIKFTYEEAADYVVKNFNDFSEKMGSFARKAFDNGWLDVYPRKGKRGGAFCSNLHSIKESRIMTNFSGSFGDMLTLAHELGHGYHGQCLMDETYPNSHYPMPIAETASTLCETIVLKAALKTASKDEAVVILENSIQGAAQVIVDIYSRFLFEDEVFKRRAGGSLTVDELKEIMLDSQKKAYGNGLDHNYLHPYMWVCKTHYYYAHRNYYNFPYAYGQLFALGLYGLYLHDNEAFVKNYDVMLAATGKNNLRDVAGLMGINVEDKAFWASSLKLIEQDIEEFCSMV